MAPRRPPWWRFIARRRYDRQPRQYAYIEGADPENLKVERFRELMRMRLEWKNRAAEDAADALALEVDLLNGAAVYSVYRAALKERK